MIRIHLVALLAAAGLAGCQTVEQAKVAPPAAASCSEARQRIVPLAAENDAFNRKVRRAGGRGAARTSDVGLSSEEAARRADVVRELGALNEFSDRNNCPSPGKRRH
ncbi:conserved hypothetical protein [Hyphomicrobiales bacterium]|nr:conserved hypothetical protein [Hyphomicrobiales bacterium]CAH1700539.1 conserved hypothetical protein [Hyphomicrobiales bacterium]CAI0344388.1 conserved hypothetical protein [Hyphomicrobiales bacterium]